MLNLLNFIKVSGCTKQSYLNPDFFFKFTVLIIFQSFQFNYTDNFHLNYSE